MTDCRHQGRLQVGLRHYVTTTVSPSPSRNYLLGACQYVFKALSLLGLLAKIKCTGVVRFTGHSIKLIFQVIRLTWSISRTFLCPLHIQRTGENGIHRR